MQTEEIIRMAREVWGERAVLPFNELERFAALVAAHECEKLKNVAIFSRWYQELDAAVMAEREACAKVCDTMATPETSRDAQHDFHWAAGCCAAAIRARGN